MKKRKQEYVIGVDGGGTKTIAALSDLKGKILKKIRGSSTNIHKVGFREAIFNLKKIISELIKGYQKEKIKFCYLGLAGGLERDKRKREEIEKLLKRDFPFPLKVEGDQRIGFYSGTDEKNGVLVIGGTGSISMGWKDGREEISGGWDWLIGDQGSAFWIGRRALEEMAKFLDGRRKKEKLFELISRKWKIKKERDLYRNFYHSHFVEKVASVSEIVDLAAQKGDRLAKEILKEAAKELAKMASTVIKKLKFKKEYPLVLVGGVFKSKIVLERFKREIKKKSAKAKFIQPKEEPVKAAIKLAIENLKKKE